MPYIETPSELAESIADMLGIYGSDEEHSDGCRCRVCFVSDMAERMRQAVRNEYLLEETDV